MRFVASFLDWCRPRLVWWWWHVTIFARMLWVCRASALPVLVGMLLIGWTDQARDIVVADTVPSFENLRPLLGILIAVTIWATVAWYWARVTVQHGFVNPVPADPIQQPWHGWLTVELPRWIGTAGMLSVALAFWQAHKLYAYAGDLVSANRFLGIMWLYIAMAGAFYLIVRNRAWIIRWLISNGIVSEDWEPDRTQTTRIFDPDHPFSRWFLIVTLLAAPAFYFLVLLDPVAMSEVFFAGAVPAALFGFALMVPVASFLVMLSKQVHLPLFGTSVAAMIAVPILFGDFHEVRVLRVAKAADGTRLSCDQQDKAWLEQFDTRRDLRQAYFDWWSANAALTEPIEGATKAPPLVMVATAGGASRAAFWTSQVLGEIAAREERFADRLFMISGVSGGSLGAVTFRSIIEADRRASPDGKGSPRLPAAADDARKVIERDFLGPTFAAGLYVDLPSNAITFLPRTWLPDDRAVALEKAWENAWMQSGIGARSKAASTTGGFAWDQGFVASLGGEHPWPVLALNGTAVEKGKRIITSNVKLWVGSPLSGQSMSGAVNRYDTFSITKADMPVSTAVTMSARFPIISPTGALRDCNGKLWSRITDGGLFENFGALTLEEVVRYLVFRLREVQSGHYQAVPMAILISSDPGLDQLHLREDGHLGSVSPDCAAVDRDGSPLPREHAGNAWPECPPRLSESASLFGDPITALYDGRVARGEAAATALLDRITDTRIPLRDRLTESLNDEREARARNDASGQRETSTAPSEASEEMVRRRLGLSDHTDFFHFRQCRVPRRKGPTMSWHDSAGTWEVLREMLGLDADSGDECGNRAEFFRLCMRLQRIAKGMNDLQASNDCARRWPRPANWLCIEFPSGWRCGLSFAMGKPLRAQML